MSKKYSPISPEGDVIAADTGNYAAVLGALDHSISIPEAKAMVDSFDNEGGVFPSYETFNAACIQELLNAPGSVGLRIYNGTDANDNVFFVLTSVDAAGNDVLNPLGTIGEVAEAGQRYPDRPRKPRKPGSEVASI